MNVKNIPIELYEVDSNSENFRALYVIKGIQWGYKLLCCIG